MKMSNTDQTIVMMAHAPRESINGFTYSSVAKALGNSLPTLSDFVPGKLLRPSAIGLARCQSADYVSSVHKIMNQSEQAGETDPEETNDRLLLYTVALLCADENRRFVSDDDAFCAFIDANMKWLARLLLPAVTLRYPGVLTHLFAKENS